MIYKTLIISIFWIANFTIIPSAYSDRNVVPNSDVEKGAKGNVEGWKSYTWGGSKFLWDDTVSRSRKHSLKIQNGVGSWYVTFPATPGKLYRSSVYYKSCDADSGERLVCYLFAKNRVGELSNAIYYSRPLKTYEEWQRVDLGDYIAGPDCKEIIISLRLSAQGQKAEIWFDDVTVEELEKVSTPSYASLLAQGDGYVVWGESGSQKVFRDDPVPGQDTINTKIVVNAARGETEPFQIVIRSDLYWDDVSLEWSDLNGPVAISKDNITCHRVEYINIKKTSGAYGHPGLNPDPLPIQPMKKSFTLSRAENQAFWFLITVSPSTPPGTYTGNLTLHRNGHKLVTIPLEINIWNFTLTAEPSIDINSNLWVNEVMKYEKGDILEVLKSYYRNVFANRARTGASCYLPINITNGHASLDTSEYEKHLKFISHLGSCRKVAVTNLLWVGHKGSHKWPADASWKGVKIFLDSENAILNPKFEIPFREATRQILDAMKRQGCYRQPIIKFFDEPTFLDQRTVNALKSIAMLLKNIDQNIRIRISANYPHPDLTDYFDEWNIHADYLSLYAEEIETASAKGAQINIYHNSINLIDLPVLRTRLFPWMLWKFGFDGALCWWSITYWKENPWEMTENNSGILLYPPRSKEERGPITSIRWEMLRQGLEDYEYFYLLKKNIEVGEALLPHTRGTRKLQLLESLSDAKYALSRVEEIVQKFPKVDLVNDQPYSLDTAKVEEIRICIARSIENIDTFLKSSLHSPKELRITH